MIELHFHFDLFHVQYDLIDHDANDDDDRFLSLIEEFQPTDLVIFCSSDLSRHNIKHSETTVWPASLVGQLHFSSSAASLSKRKQVALRESLLILIGWAPCKVIVAVVTW